MVISEFRSRGPDGAGDEFVELYNPTGAAVNIGSWTIKRSSNCGPTITNMVTITAGTILQPGQHYLVAPTGYGYYSTVVPDQTYSAALTDEGGVALVSSAGVVVDAAGMCISTQYREGANLPLLSGDDDQSYERKPGGATACYDTDNNANDFHLITSPDPQNSDSIEMCFGVLTATPTGTPTRTRTRTPSPTRTRTPYPTLQPSSLVLDAFLPHPRTDWNGDGTPDVGDEYIQIINISTDPVNVKGWKLDNGVDSSSLPYTLPDMTLLPLQIAVFFHADTGIALSDGGSTVRLLRPNGSISDAFTYSVVGVVDRTWCRLPDGTGAWTFSCRPTPGKPNQRFDTAVDGPEAGHPPANVVSACSLADTVPEVIREAECSTTGTGIVGEKTGEEVWLKSRWKWDVFVR